MTHGEFKTNIRTNRGRLSSKTAEEAMATMHTFGAEEFLDYMLRTKKIGVGNGADIVEALSRRQQKELIEWIDSKPANLSAASINLHINTLLLTEEKE